MSEETNLSMTPSMGRSSNGNLSRGLDNSLTMSSKCFSSKLTPSRSCASQLSSTSAMIRHSALLNNVASSSDLSKNSGLVNMILTSLNTVSSFLSLGRPKSSLNKSKCNVFDSSTMKNLNDSIKSTILDSNVFDSSTMKNLNDSIKSTILDSNNRVVQMPGSSVKNVKKISLDDIRRPSNKKVGSGSVKISTFNVPGSSNSMNTQTDSFRSINQQRDYDGKEPTSSGKKLKLIKLDKNGNPMNTNTSSSSRLSSSKSNNLSNNLNPKMIENSQVANNIDNSNVPLENRRKGILLSSNGETNGKLYYVKGNQPSKNIPTCRVERQKSRDKCWHGSGNEQREGSARMNTVRTIHEQDEHGRPTGTIWRYRRSGGIDYGRLIRY